MSFNLQRARELCAKATDGPWERSANWHVKVAGKPGVYERKTVGGVDDWIVCQIQGPSGLNNNADADFHFIAEARTLLPAACDEVERLRNDVAECRKMLLLFIQVHQSCDRPSLTPVARDRFEMAERLILQKGQM